ncbi:MAG: phytanoyl-CoA dioxygenase family protein [Armatimonadetes bacterium]|nr:phytanoyl-CoA dioxygenase family protein [Armatimonadota bacterium]
MDESAVALSAEQLRFFATFGYLAFPGALLAEVAGVTAAFEEVWTRHGGGHYGSRHEGRARSCIVPFIDQHEHLAALVDHPVVLAIGRSVLGDDFNYMGSDGNYYVGDTGWHSDGWHPLIRHLKIAFYLDPLTRDTGCLRVIPGSHRVGEGYSEDLQRELGGCRELLGVEPQQVPAVALEVTPGDLVCFNHNTKHAAFGGGARRRMFTINLSQRYPDERLGELRDYISGAARFWIDRVYGEAMVATAGPERQRHLEQVMANDAHLAELSRQARASMSEPSRG